MPAAPHSTMPCLAHAGHLPGFGLFVSFCSSDSSSRAITCQQGASPGPHTLLIPGLQGPTPVLGFQGWNKVLVPNNAGVVQVLMLLAFHGFYSLQGHMSPKGLCLSTSMHLQSNPVWHQEPNPQQTPQA